MTSADGRVVICAAALLVAILQPGVRRAVRDAIDNFRGGPPRPMHPSPADDAALLQQRSRVRQ